MSGQNRRSTGKRAASAGVALWRHIADEIERDIAHGRYDGNKLPGEKDIAESFDVNRHTVRRAIATLTDRGLLRAERGSGTFIEKSRISYAIGKRTRFSENIGSRGQEAGGRMIAAVTEPASAEIAERLQLAVQAPVIRIDAVRQANRMPICIGTSWLDAARFPQAGKIYASVGSITRTLAHFGVSDYMRRSTHIVSTIADAADAAALGLAPGRPLLIIDSIDVDGEGHPVVTSRARFAADRVELSIGE